MGYLFEDWMDWPLGSSYAIHKLSLGYTKDNIKTFVSIVKDDNAITSVHFKEEEETLMNNIVKFNANPMDIPPTGNWLLDLPIGTKFTVQSKKDINNFMCLDLELVNKTARTAILYELASGSPLGGTGRVVASRFISMFDKLEIIPTYEKMLEEFSLQKEETGDENGGSNRTVTLDD